MPRWNLSLQPTNPIRATPLSAGDYLIWAAYRESAQGRYFGSLKVVRRTDGRKLYPFDGAAPIGPYPSPNEARDAAQQLGERLVDADIRAPEA